MAFTTATIGCNYHISFTKFNVMLSVKISQTDYLFM